MEISISPRALDVLKRGFEIARLDPATYGVRIRQAAGKTQTSFSDGPEPTDAIVEQSGLRLFVDRSIAEHATVSIDVTSEHDTIVVDFED